MPRSWQRRRATGSVMFEYTDFMTGQLYPNDRPGLGVTLDVKPLTQIGELTQPVRRQAYNRPDGLLAHR